MAETGALPPLLVDAGLWTGLLLTLAVFSLVMGDNALARLAQHILVGAALGYAAVMTLHYVIGQRLLAPLARGEWTRNGLPLILGLLLIAAALERMAAQGRPATAVSSSRRMLQTAGVVPLALLLGVGISAGIIGIVQGTLIPQSAQVMGGAFRNGRVGPAFWSGLLTLLLTTATLLAVTMGRTASIEPLPRPMRVLLNGWVWLGERALWIASGVIVARLFASRLTMLVDRLDYLFVTLQATGLWQWFASIGANIIR